MENDEFLKGITKRIIEGLTPKEVKVLDRLRLSNKEIANELGGKPGAISQVLNSLCSKFNPIINFEGSPRKRTMLYSAWQEIRKQYKIKLAGEQDS